MDRELKLGSGTSWFGTRKDGIAQANTLLFHPVEETTCPYEFGGQDAQRQHDGEPAGPWSDDHQDPQNKQGEPEEDLQEALRLL